MRRTRHAQSRTRVRALPGRPQRLLAGGAHAGRQRATHTHTHTRARARTVSWSSSLGLAASTPVGGSLLSALSSLASRATHCRSAPMPPAHAAAPTSPRACPAAQHSTRGWPAVTGRAAQPQSERRAAARRGAPSGGRTHKVARRAGADGDEGRFFRERRPRAATRAGDQERRPRAATRPPCADVCVSVARPPKCASAPRVAPSSVQQQQQQQHGARSALLQGHACRRLLRFTDAKREFPRGA